jgi:hypothetical protein
MKLACHFVSSYSKKSPIMGESASFLNDESGPSFCSKLQDHTNSLGRVPAVTVLAVPIKPHRSGAQQSRERRPWKSVPNFLSHNRGSSQKLGSNLGPFAAELDTKPNTTTQNKAKRTN